MSDRTTPLSMSELANITLRGKWLYAYTRAVASATERVLSLRPNRDQLQHSIGQKTEFGWNVVFGRLNDDQGKFLIFYEATSLDASRQFSVQRHDSPKEDRGFYWKSSRAIETAATDFQLRSRERPYIPMVLPSSSHEVYVYLVPAQIKAGTYPLGGDCRYLISGDGKAIVEKRQLHRTILEIAALSSNPRVHTHMVTDTPEDTDVLHVLTRQPPCQEYIITEHHFYIVDADGTIRYGGDTATGSLQL